MRPLRAAVAVAFVAGFTSGGCEPGDAREGASGPPRFARSFLPVGSQWIAESEVPAEPQETPRMVIWEVSTVGDTREASDAERAAADDLVRRTWEAAEKNGWFEFQRGIQDGYKLLHGDKRHYYNEKFIFDDAILDPERPEFLMYYGTPEGQKLAGMMFYTRKPEERGPEIGGPLTLWHYHVWSTPNCLLRGMLSIDGADADGRCARGEPFHRSPEMIHVWLLDHPGGPFSTSMWLAPEQLRALIERDEQREAARRAATN